MMTYQFQFFNDYAETAHDACLQAVAKQPLEQEPGYGLDRISEHARDLIKQRIQAPEADIHFVSGGTQANLTVIGSILRPHEAIIAVESGHISTHETGAIEATGHKVIHVPQVNGKLTVDAIVRVMQTHPNEHSVKPRMVFVSQSTELGTVYSHDELRALRQCCDQRGLYLYLDGARLGTALVAEHADVTLPDLAKLTDVFYIGGTKNGALLGEAIVIVNPALQSDFRYALKQRGALLAKGRVIASQFVALFEGDLYLELARHANASAQRLQQGLTDLGFAFQTQSPTNQIFPIMHNRLVAKLQQLYGFLIWEALDDDTSVIRLVCSWATPMAKVEQFLSDVQQLSNQF